MAWQGPKAYPESPVWDEDVSYHMDGFGRVERPPKPPEKLAAAVLGAAAAAVELQKPIARRSLLFPWRRR